ncbi:hypothetical protein [Stutzerimonas kirkiae]|uniref:hypothetical protein n=1 Tax=Stutzerimonas kirkiae TaxID=2211392 RepID=UPI0010383C09|nr:hypothetical protein [Stutzerimonas kirkiae]
MDQVTITAEHSQAFRRANGFTRFQEVSSLLDSLLETGASYRESQTTLQALTASCQAEQQAPA